VTGHVTSQVAFPAVAFRVPVRLPGDSRGGGSRSRSVLSVAAHRGWFDSATKWAVDVGNGRVAPALSSAPTETPNVRLDSIFIFLFSFLFLSTNRYSSVSFRAGSCLVSFRFASLRLPSSSFFFSPWVSLNCHTAPFLWYHTMP
jgi:hypothetical protein